MHYRANTQLLELIIIKWPQRQTHFHTNQNNKSVALLQLNRIESNKINDDEYIVLYKSMASLYISSILVMNAFKN